MAIVSGKQSIRIIGGQWRSRRLSFIAGEGLRPTPDRVRETLFNWLQFELRDAVYWDAFSGSGALGLEALSRGAKSVIFFEKNAAQAKQLQENLKILQQDSKVIVADFVLWLEKNAASYVHSLDGIFLDPPFHVDLLEKIVPMLLQGHVIKPEGFLYIETEKQWSDLAFSTQLVLQKSTKAGMVNAYLARIV
jgi:16S rRNA (guanine966-N2)-methyltransferase